ncbi:hypothetical protein BDFB_002390 [Asbolus verrucosus]|uniref:Uncharacterized protein n=1 Tax=Asbolus verrucosus TaxID=1661398 RepID=A0A482VBL4_ASBVE|nr:hypothetical protein BDFB_002390 [Asbolus verrucosus]
MVALGVPIIRTAASQRAQVCSEILVLAHTNTLRPITNAYLVFFFCNGVIPLEEMYEASYEH